MEGRGVTTAITAFFKFPIPVDSPTPNPQPGPLYSRLEDGRCSITKSKKCFFIYSSPLLSQQQREDEGGSQVIEIHDCSINRIPDSNHSACHVKQKARNQSKKGYAAVMMPPAASDGVSNENARIPPPSHAAAPGSMEWSPSTLTIIAG